jgi:hypothetical protein
MTMLVLGFNHLLFWCKRDGMNDQAPVGTIFRQCAASTEKYQGQPRLPLAQDLDGVNVHMAAVDSCVSIDTSHVVAQHQGIAEGQRRGQQGPVFFRIGQAQDDVDIAARQPGDLFRLGHVGPGPIPQAGGDDGQVAPSDLQGDGYHSSFRQGDRLWLDLDLLGWQWRWRLGRSGGRGGRRRGRVCGCRRRGWDWALCWRRRQGLGGKKDSYRCCCYWSSAGILLRLATIDQYGHQGGYQQSAQEGQYSTQSLLAQGAVISQQIETLCPDRLAGSFCRTRFHGDYHLGQVLVTQHDIQIIDFEGEQPRPGAARVRKHSPLRDVAGMLRSFNYAASSALQTFAGGQPADQAALEPVAQRWEREVAAAFLTSYGEGIAGCCAYPDDPAVAHDLVELFVLEKALYEINYEINHRPGWVSIPVQGILSSLRKRGSGGDERV